MLIQLHNKFQFIWNSSRIATSRIHWKNNSHINLSIYGYVF